MTSTGLRKHLVATALLIVLAPGLAACSHKDSADQTPEQALAGAKSTLDRADGVHLVLSTDNLPKGINGLVSADGVGTHAPAFKGSVKVMMSGFTTTSKVIATGGTVYAVLPFTTDYAKIDPADYGAPDPAALMDTEGGLSSLLTEAKDVTAGKQQREGSQVLDTYTGTISGSTVSGIIPSADATRDFDVTFRITDDDKTLHQAVLTGPFYARGGDVTYTITLDHYGTAPSITAP